LSVPVQVIAWRTMSEVTCNVSSGTLLNLTHSLSHSLLCCTRELVCGTWFVQGWSNCKCRREGTDYFCRRW